jgi:hypothetical protein
MANEKLTFSIPQRSLKVEAVCEISGSYGGEYEDDCFWGVAPCSLVEVYRRFRGTCSGRSP